LKRRLGGEDPVLGAIVEEIIASEPSTSFDKVGGVAKPIQRSVGSPLLLQMDFEQLDLSSEKKWRDAGLFGAIYVVDGDEPTVEWQYT